MFFVTAGGSEISRSFWSIQSHRIEAASVRLKPVKRHKRTIWLKIEPSGEAHELWRSDKGFTGVIPSPLLYDGVLYVVKNGGILTSFDAATGKVIKAGRVEGALGGYSSSPVAAEGRIYLSSEEGKMAILRAGGEWQVTQVNDLEEPLFATPALSEGQIYVRSGNALYRFGNAAPESK